MQALNLHPVHMPHLAARPRLGLAVEVERGVALAGDARARAAMSSPIRFSITTSAWRAAVAQRPARDGADVLLELVDGAAVLRPVAGVVDARRDLVDDQALRA